MTSTLALPIVDVSGPPRIRGQQQGEAMRERIVAMLQHYHSILPPDLKQSWEQALREARKYLPFAEQVVPQFVDELRGIAQGANVPFADAWLLNCYEELSQQPTGWGCTCLAVRDDLTAGGHVLVAHNEDWQSDDRAHVYLVRSRPDEGPAFIGLTYGPLLVNLGLNAAGIGVAINSVYPTDNRVGVPRILCSRAILAADTIGKAIEAAVPAARAGGYNYLLADDHGEIYCVETSATCHDLLYAEDGWLAHTNHYLSPRMQALQEAGVFANSQVRLNRARRLLQGQLGQVSVASLQDLLRDHVNLPTAICCHENPADQPHERFQTVSSLVMDLNERLLWAAPGPPCENEFHSYSL